VPLAAHQTASHGISGEVSNDTRQRPGATTAVNTAPDTTQVNGQRLSMVYGENANLFTTQEGNLFTTWLNCPTVAKMLQGAPFSR
jgi:hypothetical protein